LQRVATRSGFIEDAHRSRGLALQLPHQAPHRVWLVRQLPRYRLRLLPNQHRDEEVLLCASIPTYVVTCCMTGSLRCGAGALER
jgi:hypothetical protein